MSRTGSDCGSVTPTTERHAPGWLRAGAREDRRLNGQVRHVHAYCAGRSRPEIRRGETQRVVARLVEPRSQLNCAAVARSERRTGGGFASVNAIGNPVGSVALMLNCTVAFSDTDWFPGQTRIGGGTTRGVTVIGTAQVLEAPVLVAVITTL